SAAWDRIASEAKLAGPRRAMVTEESRRLVTYLALREEAKHHLMRGYALIRQTLVAIDRRPSLHGGVFCLTPEELPRLLAGDDLAGLIAQRRRRRSLALSLDVPPVLFSDDLEMLGHPHSPLTTHHSPLPRGIPLSAGVAEGPALVL